MRQAREQVSTVDIDIDNEGENPPVLYTANISSQTMYCNGLVNGIDAIDNLARARPPSPRGLTLPPTYSRVKIK
ncbi:hypothetical protein [Salinivibrio costicola]|uniref:hypothetical protein n=1 Tax=Salinivibrio costicola TaxID=51367 RepID=UPI00056541E9|nr:hypothetical protein [Salinivibrio costicola]